MALRWYRCVALGLTSNCPLDVEVGDITEPLDMGQIDFGPIFELEAEG